MATISESYESRPFRFGTQTGRELVYNIFGTEDDLAVEILLRSTAPSSYQGLRFRDAEVEPIGAGVWRGRVRYEGNSSTNEFAFDTSGGSQQVTQSIGTVGRYAPAGMVAPDFQGAIGVSDDKVEGCEVVVPNYTFQETHHFTFADLAALRAYSLVLMRLTGAFNDDDFKGLAAGECLFLGASGSGGDLSDFAITFRFQGSPNAFGLEIGGDVEPYGGPYGGAAITGIDKLGHDYLWVRYAEFQDGSASALVKRPVACYVERVYYPADFSQLGIGT